MGREIRMVPPNYEHPICECTHWPRCNNDYPHYLSQRDKYFEDAYADWLKDFNRIKNHGLNNEEKKYYKDLKDWLENDGHPIDLSSYRTYRDEEATWYQCYQTVSEGSPVTPPFATKEELIDYLVNFGDFWQQERWKKGDKFMQPNPPGYSREGAEEFVNNDSYAPSFIIYKGKMAENIEACTLLKKDNDK